MTDERILLDNLHGRVVALTALCSTLMVSDPRAEVLFELFKQELEELQSPDVATKGNDYFLGLKAVQDLLGSSLKSKKADLPRLFSGNSETEH